MNSFNEEEQVLTQLLQHPQENEQEIVNLLSDRFERLQHQQNIIYTLVIGEIGSTVPYQLIQTDQFLLLRIPVFHV